MMYLLQAENLGFIEQAGMWLEQQDKLLFININRNWTNAFFDSVFPVYRESITWVPLYLFLFLFMIFNFGAKAWPWILFLIVTVTLCDQISSAFVKDFFLRPRPCRDPFFSDSVRLLMNRCPSSGSFTSSHATNHFGVTVFMAITMKDYFKRANALLFFWAITICYGQVYVGVHYPLDVIGGAGLGTLIGWGVATFYKNKIGLPPLKVYPAS